MNMGDFPPNAMEHNGLPRNLNGICKHPAYVLPVDVNNENDQHGGASNQLVLYSPPDARNTDKDVLAAPDTTMDHIGPFQSSFASGPSSRVLPSVGAFTVQCAACFKWRFVPTKEKYEEIRESILQQPFVCGRAREWRPDISCDVPADISQDGSRLWAIDKPNIAQPPPGWERLLRIRGEGSTKFADIYYVAPSGKRLRSMVEIQKYLLDHPDYIRNGVHLSQFSFQIPKPLQDNYVRKRPPKTTNLYDAAAPPLSIPIGPCEVNPIAWARPPTCTELQLGGPGLSTPYSEPLVYQPPVQFQPVLPTPYSKPPVKHEPGVPTPYSEPPVYQPPVQFQQLPTPYSEHPVYHHPVKHEPGLSTPYSEPPVYQPPVQFRPGLPTPYPEPPVYQHRVKHEPGLSTPYSEPPVYQPPVDRGPGLATPYSGPTLYQPPVEPRPRKKRAVHAPAKAAGTSSVCDEQKIKVEDYMQGFI